MTDGEKLLVLTIVIAFVAVLAASGWATFMTVRLRRRSRMMNKRINRLP